MYKCTMLLHRKELTDETQTDFQITPLLYFLVSLDKLIIVRLSWICIKVGILILLDFQGCYKDETNYTMYCTWYMVSFLSSH